MVTTLTGMDFWKIYVRQYHLGGRREGLLSFWERVAQPGPYALRCSMQACPKSDFSTGPWIGLKPSLTLWEVQ